MRLAPRPARVLVLVVSPRGIRRALIVCTLVVIGLGLVAALVHHGWRGSAWTALLSLSYEGNLPNWYSSALLFCSGLALAAAAAQARRSGAPYRRRWAFLSAAFFYISFDESVGLHEQLNDVLKLRGALHYGWVVPAGALVLLLVAIYFPFVRALASRMRWQVVLAAGLYVGGALLVELPLGL